MANITQSIRTSRNWQRTFHNQRELLIIWGVLLVLIIAASYLAPNFTNPRNIRNIITQSAALALVSIGQTFVLLIAGIDISVGSTISMVVTIMALMMAPTPISMVLTIFVGLAAGSAVGLSNGLLVTKLRMSPFMVTLATLSIVQGLALVFSQTPPSILPREFSPIFTGAIGPIPVPLLVVVGATLVATFILRQTCFGRHVYAVGSNEHATRLSGMATDRIKIAVYMISGFMAGFAGVFIAARSRAGDPLIGTNFAFDSITAVMLGGASLFGGRGTVYGTIAGVFIIAILGNMLNLMGVPSNFQFVLRGLLLILAVILYYRN